MKKLCEFEGKALPEYYKSDCYQDVDESDYACKEKYRIMVRLMHKKEIDLLLLIKRFNFVPPNKRF